jgi:hypothetical protein
MQAQRATAATSATAAKVSTVMAQAGQTPSSAPAKHGLLLIRHTSPTARTRPLATGSADGRGVADGETSSLDTSTDVRTRLPAALPAALSRLDHISQPRRSVVLSPTVVKIVAAAPPAQSAPRTPTPLPSALSLQQAVAPVGGERSIPIRSDMMVEDVQQPTSPSTALSPKQRTALPTQELSPRMQSITMPARPSTFTKSLSGQDKSTSVIDADKQTEGPSQIMIAHHSERPAQCKAVNICSTDRAQTDAAPTGPLAGASHKAATHSFKAPSVAAPPQFRALQSCQFAPHAVNLSNAQPRQPSSIFGLRESVRKMTMAPLKPLLEDTEATRPEHIKNYVAHTLRTARPNRTLTSTPFHNRQQLVRLQAVYRGHLHRTGRGYMVRSDNVRANRLHAAAAMQSDTVGISRTQFDMVSTYRLFFEVYPFTGTVSSDS